MIGKDRSFIAYISFSYIYFIVFVVALYFSVSQDNFIISGVGGFFGFIFYIGLIYILYKVSLLIRAGKASAFKFKHMFMLQGEYGEPRFIFLTVLFILLPLIVSFIYAFKKFDIRPSRNFNKRYFKVFLTLFVVCLGLSFIFAYRGTYPGFRHYHLTQSHRLFEFLGYDDFVQKIYDDEKVTELASTFNQKYINSENEFDPQKVKKVVELV